MPSPQLRLFGLAGERHPRGRARDLYFITNTLTPYPDLINNWPIGDQIGDYLSRQERFILALDAPSTRALRVRLHPLDWGWRQKDRLLSHRPDLRLDAPGLSFLQGLSSAKLVVFDHLGTAFLEALAYGVPCMAFHDSRIHRIRETARPDVELLEKAGMLFQDPETAAKEACGRYSDPSTWWDSPEVRRARERWMNRYTGSGVDRGRPWADFLRTSGGGNLV